MRVGQTTIHREGREARSLTHELESVMNRIGFLGTVVGATPRGCLVHVARPLILVLWR